MDLSIRIEKEFLSLVYKPGRYTGNEYNMVLKDPTQIKVRAALAFPDIYELGMSYVGFEILYHILNSKDHIWAERVYAPWIDAEQILRDKKIPLFTLESKTALVNLDWIGFSLQYELSYSNILNMLDLGGIPLRTQSRTDQHPFVIGGGPLSCNPEPVADFFDAILIGDGEEAVLEISDTIAQCRENGFSREQALEKMAAIEGVYVPSFYQVERNQFGNLTAVTPQNPAAPGTIRKRIVPELAFRNYPLHPLVPLIEVTHDRLSVEIMRGCTEGCRFCNAGMIYRPVRQRLVSHILSQSEQAIRSSGFNEISLLSLNSSDYRDLNWLMLKEKMLVSQQQIKFSFPSLRLDGVTPELADFVRTVKKTGFTFAPEAGSQRLRNVINKNIREEDLLNTLRMILEKGWQQVKFYFMIGLPTEKDEDILAISDLIEKCRQIAAGFQNVRFSIAISPFSPKPHTPFQWEKQDPPEELNRKLQILQHKISTDKIKLTWRDGYTSSLETIFVRGGRELSSVLETAWQSGARFDAWSEEFDWDRWEKAFKLNGIRWREYLRPVSVSAPLPWDHIDMGITKPFLQQEKMRAYEGRTSRDCKDYVCIGCGLQRKDFEALVDCYREEKATQGDENQLESSMQLPESRNSAREQISYGRGVKRRKTAPQLARKKIRLRYSKTGLARFISHLDIIRVFDRAARRADISLVYSQGFTPRPKISFGPPLGLGIASIAEYLDMEAEISSETDIQQKLNAELPLGIKILARKTIFQKVPSLSAIINRFEFITFLEDFELPQDWLTDWMSREEIIIKRGENSQAREMNIRPFVKELKLEGNNLHISIESIDGRMAKVTEVLDSLMDSSAVEYRRFLTQRTGQFVHENERILDPFEII